MWKNSHLLAILSSALLIILISILTPTNSNEISLSELRVERSVYQPKNSIRAEGDEEEGVTPDPGQGGEGPPAPGGNTNSTSKLECLNTVGNSNGRSLCCLQYTWPGYHLNPQLLTSNAPRNCSTALKDDPLGLCRDPIVYANSTTGRPDPQLVSEICEADGHNCFCAATSACLTYVIYDTTIGEPRKNETHFCGNLRQVDGTAMTSGCYRENRGDGLIHEICACNNEPFCNGSTNLHIHGTIILIALLITLKTFLIL